MPAAADDARVLPRPVAGKDGWMKLRQRDVGDFRIYAGALDLPHGGYRALVEVHRLRGVDNPPEVVLSSDRGADGFRFDAPAEALRHALNVGHQVVRQRLSRPR